MDTPTRTLSRREAELIGWLEAERRLSLSLPEVRETLGWSDSVARNTLSRLAKKGWLRRIAQGRYETLLAETGGWSVPNPWAALSSWGQRYYVGFKSAASEHGLTPERPGSVQACVPTGAKRPRAWAEIPIVFIFFARFDPIGAQTRELHGFEIEIASPEKVLVDGAARPDWMGGVLGLARVVDRPVDSVDWATVVRFAASSSRGRVSLRRLAALVELLKGTVPEPLAEAATALPGESPLFLGERRTYGARGKRLPRWQVIANLDPSVIRDDAGR